MNIDKLPKVTQKGPSGKPGGKPLAAMPLAGLALDLPAGHHFTPHSHREGQLIYASSGIAVVGTPEGAWAVPPQQAVWVPPGVFHEIRAADALALRTLYIQPAMSRQLPAEPYVLAVSPMLRELILSLLSQTPEGPAGGSPSPDNLGGPRRRRLLGVIMDEISAAKRDPWFLPLPREKRLRKVTGALLGDPSDGRSLEGFSKPAGASPRTLARLFVAETGMTFGAWRERLRLVTAMRLLADGVAVTTVAFETGYQSPSAFIAMFKRATGQSPGRYFRKG